MHPDDAYQRLSEIYDQFADFCRRRGQVSEADTRAKIIDRILKEVLDWPESTIGREDPVHHGYLDYLFSPVAGRGLVVVEAKREGIPFDLPIEKSKKPITYQLNKSIRTHRDAYEAIEQAQKYCVEKAVRYAVVTNGYAWIVFRALRDDIPWREGSAVVYSSASTIKSNFTAFWNLLSYEAIKSGRLEAAFAGAPAVVRRLQRPLDGLRNADQLLVRNRLHTQLNPLVERIFGDIADSDQIEILEKCYVRSKTLWILDKDLKMVIGDAVPRFAALEGAVDTTPGPYDAGNFGVAVEGALSESEGSVFLLLGGIGAGKSTFLKRFFHFVRRHFIEHMGVWFYVPFLKAPELRNLEGYVYSTILKQMRQRYGHLDLETRQALLDAYRVRIDALNKTILKAENLTDTEYQRRLNTYLEKWTSDEPDYVRALLGSLRRRGKAIVICIDNVDQLSPDYQHEIFLLSQRIAGELHSVTIVALREESFYTASIQRTFTAYTNRKFHISSPSFRKLIGTRLRYARGVLSRPENETKLILKSGMEMDKDAIDHFLQILEMSLFGHNRNIARFIECVSFGNMREALDMFASFLYSGNTDVDKMLGIYSKTGIYYVPFHEFAKAVILGDRRFYRESESKVLNVFDVGPERNSSHFTCLRLLSFLMQYHGASSPEGLGYASISRTLGVFVDIMDNEEDFVRSADKLLRKALIEVDTRSTESIQGASYVRITAAGWYYLNYLSRAFAYLDLVLQDTPVDDDKVYTSLLAQIKQVELAIETEAKKEERLELRFKRVNIFLDYLEREEQSEREKYGLDKIDGPIARPIVGAIREQFDREVVSIKKRVGGAFIADVDEPETPALPIDLSPVEDAEEETDEISGGRFDEDEDESSPQIKE